MDVRQVLADRSAASQGLLSARQLSAAGVSRSRLSRAVAAGDVVRVRPHVYALAPLPDVPRFLVTPDGISPGYVAHARSVLLSVGPSAVAGGRTAAVLFGWPMLVEPVRTFEIAVPHGHSHIELQAVKVRRHRSLALWERRVLMDVGPMRLTSPVQTLIDCALTRPLLEAVVIWDSALRLRHTDLEALQRAVRGVTGVRQAARVRRVCGLAADDSGSVPETVLRLRLLQAGLDFRTQHRIDDDHGRHVLRCDFCFPEQRLVVEVDGARWHADQAKDQRTDNTLAALGWRVLRYAGSEVLRDHRPAVAQVQRACQSPIGATGSTHVSRMSAA